MAHPPIDYSHRRRSVRLAGYDYAQAGAYFITICTAGRACLLGEVVNGSLVLNELGQVVNQEWAYTALIRPHVDLDLYVVMPNHLHAIVLIEDHPTRPEPPGALPMEQANSFVGAHRRTPNAQPVGAYGYTPLPRGNPPDAIARPFRSPARTLGAIVRGFKASATIQINMVRGTPREPVWQRNYYEHVIRTEDELDHIRTYIAENPARWAEDENNPATGR